MRYWPCQMLSKTTVNHPIRKIVMIPQLWEVPIKNLLTWWISVVELTLPTSTSNRVNKVLVFWLLKLISYTWQDLAIRAEGIIPFQTLNLFILARWSTDWIQINKIAWEIIKVMRVQVSIWVDLSKYRILEEWEDKTPRVLSLVFRLLTYSLKIQVSDKRDRTNQNQL